MTSTADILTSSAAQSLEQFLALPGEQYVEAWKTLPAPAFAEMDGEFSGQFPPNYNELHKQWQAENLFNENGPRGYWLGKAYKPLGQSTGEGYNVWRMPDGRVERRVRFGTHLGVSRVDGRPALLMTYASFNRAYTVDTDTVDEIRKLADGVFVGIGTHRASALLDPAQQRMIGVFESYGFKLADSYELHERTPALPAVFVLTGPVEKCLGPDDPDAENQ